MNLATRTRFSFVWVATEVPHEHIGGFTSEGVTAKVFATNRYASYDASSPPRFRIDVELSGSWEVDDDRGALLDKMRTPNMGGPGIDAVSFHPLSDVERSKARELFATMEPWERASRRVWQDLADALAWSWGKECAFAGGVDELEYNGKTIRKSWGSFPGRHRAPIEDLSLDDTCKRYLGTPVPVPILERAITITATGIPEPVRLFVESTPIETPARVRLILMVTAVEWAVKHRITKEKPDLEWFLREVPSPPVPKIVKEYLPSINVLTDAMFDTKDRKSLQTAIECRNRIIHGRTDMPDGKTVTAVLQDIRQLETAMKKLLEALCF